MTRVARSRWARGIGRAALGSVLFAGGLATMVTAQLATSPPATASGTPQRALLSLGTGHDCAVTVTATVECWGTNRYGQLGDNTDTSSAGPVGVVGVDDTGVLSTVTSIAAGSDHTCALTTAGHVDCWGTNRDGQLGDGSSTNTSSVPVAVRGVDDTGLLSTVTSIAAGGYQTCALTTGGDVDCWGDGGSGQLGDGSYASSTVPVTVKGVGDTGLLSTVTSIAVGGYFTCVLTRARTVDCFGTGDYGQLGDDTRTGSTVPVTVDGTGGRGTTLSTVTSIAAEGYDACAVTVAGNVDCWGYPGASGLGDGTSPTSGVIPVTVRGVGDVGLLSSVTSLAGSWYSACALLSSGHVDCWGINTTGQLGDNAYTASGVPVEVETGPGALSNATAIAAGGDGACVIQSTGHVDCWGSDSAGQLGQGYFANSNVPVAVEGVGGTGTLSGATAVSAGKVQACALMTGEVRCWGKGDHGELGDGSTTWSTVPVTVEGAGGTGTLSGVTAVSAGAAYNDDDDGYTCALLSTGHVDCWGTDATGELGDGSTTYSTVPVSVKGVGGTGTLSTIAAISAGGGQTCALTTGGNVDCWGRNNAGQLGDGSTTSSTVPVSVKGLAGTGLLSTVTSVRAGNLHTCALAGGDAVCWGTGNLLGDGSYSASDIPVAVAGVGGTGTLSTVAAVAAGAYETCALTRTGHVDCWGEGDEGTLGNGTHTSTYAPVKVKGVGGTGTLSAVAAITSGTFLTCALTTAGAVDCWGDNFDGQLGDGSSVETSDVPVAVVGPGGTGLLSAISEVSAGASFACAVTAAGAVDCWGTNYYGQLGDGLISRSSAPLEVPGLLLSTSSITVSTTGATTTSACPLGVASCSSKPSVGTRGATVTTTGAKVTGARGHGTLAIGTYKHDPVGKLPGDAGAFFGLAVSTGATFKTVTFEDCSMGTGTTLDWWDGKAWVPVVSGSVVHSTVGGTTCLSVTLGSASKPSLATLERFTRSSRLGAILITSVS